MPRLTAYFLCLLLLAVPVHGADPVRVSIPAATGSPGTEVRVPVNVERVDNLAGIKLKLTWDTKLLTFKSFVKSRVTRSLIHVVNDKVPGEAILVMAGARGIRGENFPVGAFDFTVAAGAEPGTRMQWKVPEIQLMSDKLVELPAKVSAGTFTVAAQAEPETSGVVGESGAGKQAGKPRAKPPEKPESGESQDGAQ
ncbi:MAG: cohesin domain-containing protein [Desulfatibacillaceae bacterium]